MIMQRQISRWSALLLAGSALTSLFFAGCSVELVAEKDLANNPNVRLIDDSEKAIRIEFQQNGDSNDIASVKYIGTSIELSNTCRAKYQDFYFRFLDMITVSGQLPNGKEYSVWIDTGYGGAVLTNGITILENNLAVYPTGRNLKGEFVGVCHLPELQIGHVKVMNPPCEYLQIHWEWNVLGLPLWKQKGVFVGLRLLESFSYILFDNINKEIEFSVEKAFEPSEAGDWQSYPLELVESDRGYPRLMVDIPIAGENQRIMFDTCGRYGIVIGPELWQKISASSKNIKARKDRFRSGFMGWLPCQKAKIPRLDIAGQVVRNADVIILDEDSPYLTEPGYISMKYFKNSMVVFDFRQKLMWVKKAGGH